MAEQAVPTFVDEEGYGVIAPAAPPLPKLDKTRAEQRRRLFAPNFDLYLLSVVGVLCAIGLLMVYSASIDASFLATEDASTTYFFQRQLRNFFIGLVIMYVLMRLDYRIWRRLSIWMMLGTIMMLVFVLEYGDRRLEAQRALFQGSFQPGEAAKLIVVIYMAAWLASKRHKIRQVTYGIIPFSIMVGVVAFLVVLQPDLSTAASILATAMTMFFLAGASWPQITIVMGSATALGVTIALKLPYANQRIEAHLNAINDLTQANDHVQAAIAAFLNGGLFGVGLGQGRQKFGALPFPHTDSVFAVIGEELGLVGCAVVIALYVILVYRGFNVARNARDSFGALLAAGITCWLVYDALLNISVMTALAPPTGVPLPFISFGGSSLVAAMASVGLMLSVSRVSAQPQAPERRQVREVLEKGAPEEVVQPNKAELKRELKQKKAEEKLVQDARKARQKMRQEEIDKVRERLEQRKHSGPEVVESPINPLDTISAKELTASAPPAPVQPSVPTEPTTPVEGTEGTESDPNSNLGGGNRRGRVSRISCR
ncbi:MAG: FtsW/RodA/SpoVE family cell cycle protein [Anaerolineae bacterium]|nr:FtsW/RodA/SpoVE family cell cycle protein [Anaerolineae bacterium]